MISEKDLQEAIAECQGQRNPNANTCIKLAAFLIIQRELFGVSEQLERVDFPEYSTTPAPDPEPLIGDYGGSDFLRAVAGREPEAVWAVMDELMDTLRVINPRVYAGVMRRIQ